MDGTQAEQLAARFLKKQGYKISECNYLVRGGEIDIIARDRNEVVFVEVRYRKSDHYGSAEESIDGRKQQRLIKAASHYLQEHNLWDKVPCRFDTICITVDPAQPSRQDINWQKNAFTL